MTKSILMRDHSFTKKCAYENVSKYFLGVDRKDKLGRFTVSYSANGQTMKVVFKEAKDSKMLRKEKECIVYNT